VLTDDKPFFREQIKRMHERYSDERAGGALYASPSFAFVQFTASLALNR